MATEKIEYGLPQQANNKKSLTAPLYIVCTLLLALAAGAWATQRIAAAYAWHPALGAAFLPEFKFYPPWMCIIWLNNLSDAHGIIEKAITQGQCIFLAPQLVFFFFYLLLGRKPKGKHNLHGSARWANIDEIKTAGLLTGKGVYVGGLMHEGQQIYLRHNGPEHILCFAPTRSGKGVGLILPTLLAWEESSIVFDIKGENWALTSGYLKSLGHKVIKFELADASGASAAFNPVAEVRLESIYAIPDAQNLVRMILDPNGTGFDGKDAHWKNNGAALLAGVLLHCMITVRAEQGRDANLCDLSYMFGNKDGGQDELFAAMLATDHKALMDGIFGKQEDLPPHQRHQGKNLNLFIVAAARNIIAKPDSERGSVISTALTDLELYRDPVVAQNTAHSSFRLTDLMNHDKPIHLYLVVSPGEISRLKAIIRILLTQLIYKVTSKMSFANGASVAGYKHRLLFMLDELTALGKLEILEKAIAFIAGYGGKLYLIVQDTVQLTGVYSKENAIMSNCHIRSAYAPNIPETAELLSKMTGKATVVEEKTSLSGSRTGFFKSASLSVNETARPLLTPDECMRLRAPIKDENGKIIAPGDMLIFVSGSYPVFGRQILYFMDPVFSARAKIEAPVKSDTLYALPATSAQENAEKREVAVAPPVTELVAVEQASAPLNSEKTEPAGLSYEDFLVQ